MKSCTNDKARPQPGLAPPQVNPLLTGAILAGGLSRRLGRDKAALRLAGRPLVEWAAAVLAPLVAELWLITNHPLAHISFGLPLVMDLRPLQGPLGGLLTALFYARTPWVLAAAVDNPFPAPALMAALAAKASQSRRPAVVCRSPRGLEPFPGLYSTRLLPRLREYLKTERHARRFLEALRPQEISLEEVGRLDPQGRSFFNINTPAELEQAGRWLI